jgi:general secretion pathway protein D
MRLLLLASAWLLSSCASTGQSKTEGLFTPAKPLVLRESFLSETRNPVPEKNETPAESIGAHAPGRYAPLQPLEARDAPPPRRERLTAGFSETETLSVAAEGLAPVRFVHYVFGELLGLNYVVDEDLEAQNGALTLNIQDPLSPKRLMDLTLELLEDNGVSVYVNDGIYFVKAGVNQANTVIGIGRRVEDVPNTSQNVLQIVPVTFGTRITTERTINQLLEIQIIPDSEQNAFFLRGNRSNVIRAMELINLLDTPANRGRHIGLIELTYVDTENFLEQLVKLLASEGIEAGQSDRKGLLKNVELVALPRTGATAVFATSKVLVDRVQYWARVLDRPAKGAGRRYFTFSPRNARAADILESLSGLLGGNAGTALSENNQTSEQGPGRNPLTGQRMSATGNAPSNQRVSSVSSENMSIVVDQRSNSLVIYCSGLEYQTLEPLLMKLDILPKQVMLDIVIAEVTLKDEFRLGVEWAIRQNGVNYTTQGAFGATSFAGLALAINEDVGLLNATALASNSLVNVVSNPTLLVRDGVTASINVGSDIAVIGNTSIDPIIGQRQTVATEYRKTGVDVTITPTINATDIVIMDVSQKISNTVPGSSGAAGNPDIFERALNTQVVAKSGQTIMLGGLISEDRSNGDQGIPFLKNLPLIGSLARGQSQTAQKTELIMLITARVIDSPDLWDEINTSFIQGLESLDIP